MSLDTTQFLEKIHTLTLQEKHEDSITLLREAIATDTNFADDPEILSRLVCSLYHQAFLRQNPEKDTSYIDEAIHIGEALLERKDVSGKVVTNIRMYLGQIYAHRKDPRAIILAQGTFKNNPSALTANRLGSTYGIFADKEKAFEWYKEYEKRAQEEKDWPSFLVHADMAFAYKDHGDTQTAETYLKKALAEIPDTLERRSVLELLKKRFPNI